MDQRTDPVVTTGTRGRTDVALSPDELDWREEPKTLLGVQVLALWSVVMKWRWLILSTVIAGLMVGLVVTLLTTPVYRSTATLQIEHDAPKIVNVEGMQPTDPYQSAEFFQTQYGLLKSRSLAERVVRNLDLEDNPAFTRRGWVTRVLRPTADTSAAADRAARFDRATERVMKDLLVEPVRASKLINVSFDDADPATAARVSNAVTAGFIQANLERRYEASAYARSFLDTRLAQVREKLEASERELADYATRQQIINVGATGSIKGDPSGGGPQSLTATDLDSMNRALADAQQARILAEQKWRQAQATNGLGLPELQQSKNIEQLRDQKATLTADYQDKLKIFKPEHSSMQQLRARIDEIDRQLAADTTSVKEAVRAQYLVTLNNETALAAKVKALKGDFLDLQNRSIRYNIIRRDVDTSRSFYEGLLERDKEVAVAGVGSNNVSIVDPAKSPNDPIKPQAGVNLSLAGGLGLLLGLALAFGLDQMDQSIKTSRDVEQKLGLPLLGAIPLVRDKVEPLKALGDPRAAISEAYTSARTALLLSTADSVPKTLLITSAQPAEGKSTTAVALASSLAALGRRVLLIDADLRNPSIHKLLGKPNPSGFSNLLAGLSGLEAEVQPAGMPNLSLLPAGPAPPNPAELLTSGRLQSILAEASDLFDHVVLDGPPIMGLADAPLLASAAAGTIVVVESGQTGHQLALTALKRIDRGSAHILGVLLTKFDRGMAYNGDYGYAYNYESDHSTAGGVAQITRNLGKLFRKS